VTPHCPCSKQREERLQLLATALSAVPDFAYSSAHPHIARQLAHYAGTGLQDSPSTRQECAPRSPRHFCLPSLRTGRELTALDNGEVEVRALTAEAVCVLLCASTPMTTTPPSACWI